MNEPKWVRITLKAEADPYGRPVTTRLRWLLKVALRVAGFRCVRLEQK